ncbi:ribosomal protein L15 [Patellaria atrata CBS 101060]|uniref:Ribosomal protein L15 n=1 Tax=Patellaria atrata CBS 101060 TaxID=1346257 RepID=A0A9P4VS75_9PEZI|nr:ribosomal protein L15 [Patellaria atrata CBS 101060]
MPPRLKLLRALTPLSAPSTSISPFLLPFLHPQTQSRAASILSNLNDNASLNKRIRRGRGPSSGKGKTSGRGQKGQKARGKVPMTAYGRFNGGQTPDEVVHGTRGFVQHFSANLVPLNLDRVQDWIDQGRLDPSRPITIKELHESRCLHGIKDGVKLLARNADKLTTPITILVSRASTAAISAIESAGGTISTRYYSRTSITPILRGLIDPTTSLAASHGSLLQGPLAPSPDARKILGARDAVFPYRLPDATSRKHMEYYRDPEHRGYLAHTVARGQGPSLYFKAPGGRKKVDGKKRAAAVAKAENMLW